MAIRVREDENDHPAMDAEQENGPMIPEQPNMNEP